MNQENQNKEEDLKKTDAGSEEKEKTTLNLDTGETETLPEDNEEGPMEFAPGSDGGSAGDGGAA